MYHAFIITVLFLCFGMMGCTNKVKAPGRGGPPVQQTKTDKPADPNVPPPVVTNTATELEGSWRTDCIESYYEGWMEKDLIVIKGNSYTFVVDYYEDPECLSTKVPDPPYTGTFSILGADTRGGASNGQKLINWVQDGVTYYVADVQSGDTLTFGDTSEGDSTTESDRPVNLSYYGYAKVK